MCVYSKLQEVQNMCTVNYRKYIVFRVYSFKILFLQSGLILLIFRFTHNRVAFMLKSLVFVCL